MFSNVNMYMLTLAMPVACGVLLPEQKTRALFWGIVLQCIIRLINQLNSRNNLSASGTDHVIMIAWVVGSISLLATAVVTYY